MVNHLWSWTFYGEFVSVLPGRSQKYSCDFQLLCSFQRSLNTHHGIHPHFFNSSQSACCHLNIWRDVFFLVARDLIAKYITTTLWSEMPGMSLQDLSRPGLFVIMGRMGICFTSVATSWWGQACCLFLCFPTGTCVFVLHLVPFWILTIWGSVHIEETVVGWRNQLRMKTSVT